MKRALLALALLSSSCGRMPSEPATATPQRQVNPCTQPPFNCRAGAIDCYTLQNQNPGQGPNYVCSYPSGTEVHQ